FAFRHRLGQLDLDRVDTRHVMDHYANLSAISGNTALPLEFRQRAGESLERHSAQLESTGKFVTTFTHLFSSSLNRQRFTKNKIVHHLTLPPTTANRRDALKAR